MSICYFEGVGTVEDAGKGISSFKTGDQVPTTCLEWKVTADKLPHLPEWLDDREAAPFIMKSMTANYLLHRTYSVRENGVIVMHEILQGEGRS